MIRAYDFFTLRDTHFVLACKELTEGVATSKAAIEKPEADRMICVAQLAEDDTIMANQESTIKDLTVSGSSKFRRC